jgi:hypothetical protein
LTLPPKDLARQHTQGLQFAHELCIEQGTLHAYTLFWRVRPIGTPAPVSVPEYRG